ncbi:unnamed protein product [Arabis nemorensis]|uniref:Uncharacterized protein n=1 Tax=Arabis nemorensis TaxID=586526 RepID=A0A565BV82_9BRAS|nr:unnamed protein product [Arabis nemorensis]
MQAVFMMYTISAKDPWQSITLMILRLFLIYLKTFFCLSGLFPTRELIIAAVDNLSAQLHYPSRFKLTLITSEPCKNATLMTSSPSFLKLVCAVPGGILGPNALFLDGVSLAALFETSELFILNAEPKYFIHWLLPALLLHEDHTNLDWVAKMAGQPVAVLVKDFFCANLFEPPVPAFSRNTISRAAQTIVDGFLETADYPKNEAVIDMINVFSQIGCSWQFITEIHYRMSAACHHRLARHHLAALEELTTILGHRASVPSPFNYIFNFVRQFIGSPSLQDQCCSIASCLLDLFKSNPAKEVVSVLGDQFQFLVSKLVTCCINAEADSKVSGSKSSQLVNLLHKLIVDSECSLDEDIRDLEQALIWKIFKSFVNHTHIRICKAYPPKNHLLKCARRSCYLPPRFLSWSLQAVHIKLIASQDGSNAETADTFWHSDDETENAVWTLVRVSASEVADSMRLMVSDFLPRGILSIERGQQALSSLDSRERSLIEVHGRGLNLDIVERILLDSQKQFKGSLIIP